MAIIVVSIVTFILLTSFILSVLIAVLMGSVTRSVISNRDSGFTKAISGYVLFVVSTSVLAALAHINRWGFRQAIDYIYYTVYSPHLFYRWWSTGVDVIRRIFAVLSLIFFFLEAITGYFSNQIHLWQTRTLRRIQTTTDQQWLFIALQHRKPEIRRAAIARLTKLRVDIPVKSLIALLVNEDPLVRKWATQKLGDLKNPIATDYLIKMLKDQDPIVRSTAAIALGSIGDEKAVEPLFDLLGDNVHDVQHTAITALGNIGSARAVVPLEMLVDSDVLPKEAFQSLLKISKNEAHRVAVKVLQSIDHRIWRAEPLFPFSYPGGEKRRAAAEMLVRIDGSKAFPRLLAAIKSGSVETAEVISKTMSSHDLTSLVMLTQDPNSAIRTAATIALGTTNDESVVKRLIHLFQHNQVANVRRAAVLSLSRFDLPATAAILVSALEEKVLQEYALFGLMQYPNTYVIKEFLTVICDSDKDLEERKQKATLLGEIYRSPRLTNNQKSLVLAQEKYTIYQESVHSDECDHIDGIDYDPERGGHHDRTLSHTDEYHSYPISLKRYL